MTDILYPNADMLPAMLISKQPSLEKFNAELASGKYFGQVKKDGFWYQLEKTKTGEVYLFSRSKSKKTGCLSEKISNVPHIKEWAECLPNDTTLIGEIYYPGKKSNDVTKIMGSAPEKAILRQTKDNTYGGLIHYYIHDIIKYDGKFLLDTFFAKRYENYLYDKIGEDCIPSFIEFGNVFENNLQEVLDQKFANGEEGMVFKFKDGLYVPDKRPTYNFKAKTECTFDVVITGFIPPEKEYTGKEIESWKYWMDVAGNKVSSPFSYDKGEVCLDQGLVYPVTKAYYNGWVAGITVGAWDIVKDLIALVEIGRVSSGMTDFLREDMSINPDKYLNKVVEIQAMSVDKKEKTLRHARLIKLREDKPDNQCTIDEIF